MGDVLSHQDSLFDDTYNIAKITKQLLLGLKAIHGQRVAHRDLKLENLVLTKDGIVKIIDFGYAEKGSYFSGIQGTPGLVAPEIMSGKSYTKSVDIWTTGILVYEMMTGDREADVDSTISQDQHQKIISFCQKAENKPWGDFVVQCLKMDPKERPSVEQLLEHSWMQSVGDVRLNMDASFC